MALDNETYRDIEVAVGQILAENLSTMRGEMRGEVERLREEMTAAVQSMGGMIGEITTSIATLNQNQHELAGMVGQERVNGEGIALKGLLDALAESMGYKLIRPKSVADSPD